MTLEEFLTKRDALFRNPTPEAADEFCRHMGRASHESVPLAAVHKARLEWRDATEEMKTESRQWLLEHGYKRRITGARL